jgi:hypothetical protein
MPNRVNPAILLAALGCGALLLLPATAAAGNLSNSTPALVFGQVVVGAGYEESVAITNEGTDTTIEALTLTGTDPSQFEIVPAGSDCEAGLVLKEVEEGEGESCIVHIVFHPTSTGAKKATLLVESNANLIEVALEGEGIAPELSIAPSPFDFRTVAPGSASPAQTFTVANVGSSAAVVGALALTGSDRDQFQIKADTCSSSPLAEGVSCDVGVVFAPTSPGTKTAELAVPSDYPESPATVAISGTGAASPEPRPVAGGPPAGRPKPSNKFSFGKVILNRKRGTASLPVSVPGPGILVLTGKGIVARKGPGAAVVLGGAGMARLAIVPAVHREAALIRSGRAKIVARVTYTPDGGDPLTKARTIALHRRLRRIRIIRPKGPAGRRPGSGR